MYVFTEGNAVFQKFVEKTCIVLAFLMFVVKLRLFLLSKDNCLLLVNQDLIEFKSDGIVQW